MKFFKKISLCLFALALSFSCSIGTDNNNANIQQERAVQMATVSTIRVSATTTTRVQAEDFYMHEGVVIETDKPNADENNVGYLSIGDWMAYQLDFESNQTYDISFRVSGEGSPGTILFEYQNSSAIGYVSAGNTGNWDNWVITDAIRNISFTQGIKNVAIAVPEDGYNIDWIEFKPAGIIDEQSPFHGSPISIPGTIQAEDFDIGGAGIAYSDTDSVNEGGLYRTEEGVDIQECDAGGYNIGWLADGEWLEYSIDVKKAGVYKLEADIASKDQGGHFSVDVNNTTVADIQFDNTGGWQSWQTKKSGEFSLQPGRQIVRINIKQSGFNIDKIRLTTGSEGEDFTFLVIPDTQVLSETEAGADMFRNATRWIVSQKDNLNIEFVSHLGDMTQWGEYWQWRRVESAMDTLRDNGMRYSPAQGNHDDIPGLRERFPVTDFIGKPWFDDYYGGMENACYLFSAGGMDFVIVVIQSHSQYEKDDLYDRASIAWANQKFQEHSDRRGIFVTHDFYERNWLQNDVIKKNDNLFLAVCGHSSWNGGEDNWTVTTNGGSTVQCILSDYQDYSEGGQATLRYYTFKPEEDRIYAYTYNPTTFSYGTSFNFYYDM